MQIPSNQLYCSDIVLKGSYKNSIMYTIQTTEIMKKDKYKPSFMHVLEIQCVLINNISDEFVNTFYSLKENKDNVKIYKLKEFNDLFKVDLNKNYFSNITFSNKSRPKFIWEQRRSLSIDYALDKIYKLYQGLILFNILKEGK